jgi:streptogramin lyase
MARKIENVGRSPYGVPNGLQVTDEGLWVVDQITDRVALLDLADYSDYYGVHKLIRDIPSESSNTSGLTYGEGALWLAANGPADIWRPARPTDAQKGQGEILKVDPYSGETLARYPLPGGGGVHGIEYDPFEAGRLWVTTLKDQTLTKMRIADWSVEQVIPLPYKRAHGVVRVADGVWVVHTADRVVVKLSVADGHELDRIEVPHPYPEPHCLSIFGRDLLYCDASSGWVTKITL